MNMTSKCHEAIDLVNTSSKKVKFYSAITKFFFIFVAIKCIFNVSLFFGNVYHAYGTEIVSKARLETQVYAIHQSF